MAELSPHFALLDEAAPADWRPFGEDGPLDPAPFAPAVSDYYMTDPIGRASETMARCSRAFAGFAAARLGKG